MLVASSLLAGLHRLYHGNSKAAHRFTYGLIGFDVTVIIFIIVSSFLEGHPVVEMLDVLFGVVLLLDFLARIAVARHRLREIASPLGIADVVVIASLLAPVVGENLAFLRVARMLRIFRSYRLMSRLKRDFPFFRRYQDMIQAVLNLLIFIFIMTALVYETQHASNADINNYIDALYFTVTTLTTTGFGDITLRTSSGRLLSVLIMIFGVSLFLHLIQVVFRPRKMMWRCRGCGLIRHEPDAIHCKHCGALLNAPHVG